MMRADRRRATRAPLEGVRVAGSVQASRPHAFRSLGRMDHHVLSMHPPPAPLTRGEERRRRFAATRRSRWQSTTASRSAWLAPAGAPKRRSLRDRPGLLAGCGVTNKRRRVAITVGKRDRAQRRKRAGEAVRARLAARAAAVGSRGNGRQSRVPARRRDQTAGVRTGRGRLSRSRLQRAARRGGCGKRAPLPLSVGAGARRQAPDPVGVDRIRGQTPEFGTAG